MLSLNFLDEQFDTVSSSSPHDSAVRGLGCPSPLDPFIARLRALRSNARRSDSNHQTSLDVDYTGPFVPPSSLNRPRTLVLCFDGTDNAFGDNNSNVVQFFSLLKKDDPSQQMVYYQSGIGTYTVPQVMTPMKSKIIKAVDMAYAYSLDQHIMSGYEFLMQNYKRGDKICIFGFSRGAYTARALAGMVHKVGLLPAFNSQQVPFAYKVYKNDSAKGWRQSVLFKRSFSNNVEIDFVGVWDTVASVGFLRPRHLPFTASNSSIKTFRHALSLDERRVMFRPRLYEKLTHTATEKVDVSEPSPSQPPQRSVLRRKALNTELANATSGKLKNPLEVIKETVEKLGQGSEEDAEEDPEDESRRQEVKYTNPLKQTDVLEVWFAGCHSDVGGGAVSNEARHSLARIPLRWMIRQCFLARTGIQFEVQKLATIGLDSSALYPLVLPRNTIMNMQLNRSSAFLVRTPSSGMSIEVPMISSEVHGAPQLASADEDEEDMHDATCPANDQLSLNPRKVKSFGDLLRKIFWWDLESSFIVTQKHYSGYGFLKEMTMNLGRPRTCPSQTTEGIRVHRSVKTRMENKKLGYRPKLKFKVHPTWVD